MKTPDSYSGATIIEVLIVLSILSILSGISSASYRNFAIKSELRSTVTTIENYLASIRQLAIFNKRDVYVSINKEARCLGASFETPCDCAEVKSCNTTDHGNIIVLNSSSDAFDEITFDELSLAKSNYIKFQSKSGIAAGYNGSFTLKPISLVNTKMKVVLSALGRTRVCASDGHLAGVLPC